MTFLRWYDDTLDILLYRDERACFDIVVSSIGNEVFDTLPCLRVHLYFVKDDKRITLVKFHTVICGQQHEEGIKIVHMLDEIVLDLIGTLGKVD